LNGGQVWNRGPLLRQAFQRGFVQQGLRCNPQGILILCVLQVDIQAGRQLHHAGVAQGSLYGDRIDGAYHRQIILCCDGE